ncbi:MAG: type I restriction enzyme HsdR N-terminal domain-containing protein [Raineya sp.]
MIQNLDLPHYKHLIKKKGEALYIFDTIRRKYVLLTPEEWVRQQIIAWLHTEHRYPKSLMQVEKGHYYKQNVAKRTDIVVFSKIGEPFMLVECKASNIEITEKTLWQALIYNQTLGAKFILLTNGASFSLCSIESGKIQFYEQIPDVLLLEG